MGSIIVVLTFEELRESLRLPADTQISHVQVRGLAPELFLRLEGPRFPDLPEEKGSRIQLGSLRINAAGAPGIQWEKTSS